MSCYEWEHGTITLPSGQAPKLRAVLRKAADERVAAATADIERAWKHLRSLTVAQRRTAHSYSDPVLRELDMDVLHLMQTTERRNGKVISNWGKPTQKAIRESVVRRVKNDYTGKVVTETVYNCSGDASITLVGNKVIWSVGENNHAVDRARSHPLAVALFGFLTTVTWTSRSGGQIVGNNEYNEGDQPGDGGNYVVETYSAAAQRRQRELANSHQRRSMAFAGRYYR